MRYGTKNVAIFIDDVNASIETLELHVYLLRNMYAGCKNLAANDILRQYLLTKLNTV